MTGQSNTSDVAVLPEVLRCQGDEFSRLRGDRGGTIESEKLPGLASRLDHAVCKQRHLLVWGQIQDHLIVSRAFGEAQGKAVVQSELEPFL